MALDLNKLTPELRDKILKQIQYEDSRKTSSANVKLVAVHEPLEANRTQAGHTGRYAVVYTSYRRRLADEDGLISKYHTDALRYASILHSDAPDKVSIRTLQKKVKTKEEERTEIEIFPILDEAKWQSWT
jgi:hypothetical protein